MMRRARRQRWKESRQTPLRLKCIGAPVSDRFHEREEETVNVQLPERPLSEPVPRKFMGPLQLSVVTGSYNRLSLLQRMVASVRTSLRVNTSYEIIVVDGGSTDGTPNWCVGQPDITLFYGDLSGAVANFNQGFANANGKYVCMANDDIEFAGDSLQLALDFMANHPRCGAGCISQARPPATQPWVSLMAVDLNGAARYWPMAQIAVVPKWLGDHLGWWGNITSHYHGDQLLSRRIWEEGFTCSIVPDAWVRDHAPKDEIRQRNDSLGRGAKDAKAYTGVYPLGPKVGAVPTLKIPFEVADPDRPDVDIVLGTYNRLGLLQNCVEYARKAAGGLTYRFIVVDGGSTDGTLEWLRGQEDVLLVASGVLDGAVKAFNRGFARATADYVVHVNDDMAIVSGELEQAIAYLEANLGVGHLAFPSDTGDGEFKTHNCWGHTFANFGILPRWLGNYVGWWGFWTHKYFGDVHLSLRLWGLGYKVEVFPKIKCRDFLPQDGLRGKDDNAQCKRDSNEFDTRWQTRRNIKGSPPIVLIPDEPIVRKADFE